jgi:hypothetical protein
MSRWPVPAHARFSGACPQDPWLQPILRLVDTVAGITVGVACKWVNSFVFDRIIGEDVK